MSYPLSPGSPENTTAAPIRLDPFGTDHHAEAARLRASGPVTRVILPGEIPFWAVSHHEPLADLVNDDRVSKDWRNWGAYQRGEVPDDWPLWGMIKVTNMLTTDGPEHLRLRRPAARAFTARRIESLRPRVGQIVDGLLDDLPGHAGEDGAVDLRPFYAYQVPMQVICDMMDVPQSWRQRLRELVDTTFRSTVTAEELFQTQQERMDMLWRLVDLHRSKPGDDLTSALIATQQGDPEALSDEELIDTLWLLIAAGHETTQSLILNATRALLTHPAQLKLAVSGDQWADVVEETMRWDAPIGNFMARFPLEDIEVADTTVPKGDAILACYSAAGRDDSHYGEPAGCFAVGNATSKHLSFGGGSHICLGAGLARLEATIALRALFARYPGLELALPAGEVPPVPSLFSNSAAALPVRLGAPA